MINEIAEAFTRTIIKRVLWILAIIAVLVIAGFGIANAQSFDMTFSYGSAVEQQFEEEWGSGWKVKMKDQLREHWQNRKSEMKERYIQRRAQVFNFDDLTGLTKDDQTTLETLYQKRLDAIEAKRIADSTANAEAQKEIGSLYIGKAQQEPFDFMRGWEGGGGNMPDPLNTNSPTFGGLVSDLAIPVIIVLVIGVFVYVAVKRG